MTWSLLAAFAGLLLGLRFKAPALIAATGILVVLEGFAGRTPQELLLTLLASVLALQGAYLAGLFVGATWRRLRSRGLP